MTNLPSFLKEGEKNSILFANEGSIIYYIPERYFDSGYAEQDGELMKLVGIFTYAIYDANDKPIGGLKLFNFPSVFNCQPSEIRKQTNLKLTKNNEVADYRLLVFRKGDKVIVSTKVPKLPDYVEVFFRMMITGVLPNNIPYDKKHEYILRNAEINGKNYQVPASLVGIVSGELSRSPNDLSVPFRLSKNTDMTAYKNINIVEIPNIISPYTAVTSENWDESMANAITNKNHKYSPLEKLFMSK
jgi:hypothetical protein